MKFLVVLSVAITIGMIMLSLRYTHQTNLAATRWIAHECQEDNQKPQCDEWKNKVCRDTIFWHQDQ
jgi:hypothetical protein